MPQRFQPDTIEAFFLQKIDHIRALIGANDGQLTLDSFNHILTAFEWIEANPARMRNLEQLSPEYPGAEMLANVGPDGELLAIPVPLLDAIRAAACSFPAFPSWVCESSHPQSGAPVALAARWLCHLVGISHATVHLVLSVQGGPLQFLVQVRSMAKSASPGCYDLPVAGHVDAVQSFAETLRKEAREELDLDIDQLNDLRLLGGYTENSLEPEHCFYNTEYHQVFAGSLTRAQVNRLTPLPDEVAAIVLFPAFELTALYKTLPAFFAPSLIRTFEQFSIYLAA